MSLKTEEIFNSEELKLALDNILGQMGEEVKTLTENLNPDEIFEYTFKAHKTSDMLKSYANSIISINNEVQTALEKILILKSLKAKCEDKDDN